MHRTYRCKCERDSNRLISIVRFHVVSLRTHHLTLDVRCLSHSKSTMKQCPTCNRTYADDTQSFCLEDGTQLTAAYDSQATQVISPSHIRRIVPHVQTSVSASPSRRANPALYLAIAAVALFVGGGLVALFMSSAKNTSTAEPSASNSNVSNSTTSTVSTPKRNSETAAKPTSTNSESASSTTNRLPPPSSGTWFVILGSFPKNNYEDANQRLRSIQGLGYDASIIDTDNYRSLKGGLWAVVMGPFSKSYAKSVAAQLKTVRSDAYAKSGW